MPPLKYGPDGLIPAIVQDAASKRVLMMAWMNDASLEMTLKTGRMHYWSRSRKQLWSKGETSGHIQRVLQFSVDCDADTLLFEVEQTGGACHTGYASCFFRSFGPDGAARGIREPKVFDPETKYAQ